MQGELAVGATVSRRHRRRFLRCCKAGAGVRSARLGRLVFGLLRDQSRAGGGLFARVRTTALVGATRHSTACCSCRPARLCWPVVDANQLRRLPLADVGESELRGLIAAGETVAERKARLSKDGIAPTIAAFANSGGGWVLLGVHDDGALESFPVPRKADPGLATRQATRRR